MIEKEKESWKLEKERKCEKLQEKRLKRVTRYIHRYRQVPLNNKIEAMEKSKREREREVKMARKKKERERVGE